MTKTLDDLLNAYQKTAEAPSLPDNHPATGLEDATDVPTGQLIPDATAPLIEEFGNLNPDAPGSNTNDKDQSGTVSIGTETGPAESGLAPVSELKANIKDPGPDSSHPASTDKNDKYASFTDIGEVAKGLAEDFNVLIGLLREPVAPKQASAPGSQAQAGPVGNQAVISKMHPEQQKIANALASLTQDVQTAQDYSNMVRAHLAPFVEVGIRRANKLAHFIAKHAEDPMAAAAELGMGGDPAAAGADPMAGADPAAAAGGDPMAGGGGGGDPAQEAMMVLQQIADQSGLPIEQVIEELEAMIGGEGGGGEGGEMGVAPAGDPGMPPPIPAEEIPTGGEGGGEAPPPEEGKTAAAPGKGKQAGVSKEAAAARAMLGEVLRKSGVR